MRSEARRANDREWGQQRRKRTHTITHPTRRFISWWDLPRGNPGFIFHATREVFMSIIEKDGFLHPTNPHNTTPGVWAGADFDRVLDHVRGSSLERHYTLMEGNNYFKEITSLGKKESLKALQMIRIFKFPYNQRPWHFSQWGYQSPESYSIVGVPSFVFNMGSTEECAAAKLWTMQK